MIVSSPHRARYAAVLAVVLVAGGVALLFAGWHAASRSAYLWGLALAALGLSLVVFVALPTLHRLARLGMCVALAAVVVALGVWLPRRALDAEFTGENVRWSAQSVATEGKDRYSDHEFVASVFGDTVVLANRTSARFVSLADGHELAKIQADRDDTFSLAGDRLLVVRKRSAMLYDSVGKPVWPGAIRAERGVAASQGFTVLEAEDTAMAVADDGSVRWKRQVDKIRATSSRFPNVTTLPTSNIYLESGPPVLPSSGALPLPETTDEWDFVDPASGESVYRARGRYAGSVGKALITSTPIDDDRCELRIRGNAGNPSQVGCSFGKPWARGQVLFFEQGVDGSAIELGADGSIGERVALKDVSLSTEGSSRGRRLSVSDDGMAWRDGNLVQGYPALRYGGDWKFVAESGNLSLDVGRQTVLVTASVARTNPFDPRPAHSPVDEFAGGDYRITVLDQRTGAVTGSVRAHEIGSVELVRPGTALVVVDGRIMLIGRPVAGK